MRVLLDVNILVRANEKASGPARKLLLGLIAGRHTILTSADILIELARVLRYPRLQTLFGLSEDQIYEYVQFLKDACEIVPTNPSWNFPIRDASDAHILRTATVVGQTVDLTAGRPSLTRRPRLWYRRPELKRSPD